MISATGIQFPTFEVFFKLTAVVNVINLTFDDLALATDSVRQVDVAQFTYFESTFCHNNIYIYIFNFNFFDCFETPLEQLNTSSTTNKDLPTHCSEQILEPILGG